MYFIIGFIFSSIIGYLGYKKESLTKSGVLGAIITGTTIFGFGRNISWYLLLVIFFVSSSVFSFYRKEDKDEVANIFDKTGKRDIWQALANGGWPAILAIVGFYMQQEWVYIGFVAAIATVTADTWATELGVLSLTKPRAILGWKMVERGTSGGITGLGLLGSFLGSILIGISSFLLLIIENNLLIKNIDKMILFIIIASFSGVVGALADSLLGITLQRMYKCKTCDIVTEKKYHCNETTAKLRGLRWMNNDIVNFFSSIIGSVVGISLYLVIC